MESDFGDWKIAKTGKKIMKTRINCPALEIFQLLISNILNFEGDQSFAFDIYIVIV